MAPCAGPIGAASPPARYILSGICRASGRVCFPQLAWDLLQVLLWLRALALYLAVCGVLAVRGVFIHASIKNSSAGLLRGVVLLLRVMSIRGAAFAALLLWVLVWFLLQFLQGWRFLRLCCCSRCQFYL